MVKIVKKDTEIFNAVSDDVWCFLSSDEARRANQFLASVPASLFSSNTLLDAWRSFFDIFMISVPAIETHCCYGSLKRQEGTMEGSSESLSLEIESPFIESLRLTNKDLERESRNSGSISQSTFTQLSSVFGFSINDAEGFVLLNRHDVLKLTEAFFEALGASSSRLKYSLEDGKILSSGYNFIEYLVHRLLWSLYRSWSGGLQLSYVFQGVVKPEALADYSGEVLVLSLEFTFMPLNIVIVPPVDLLPDFFASAGSRLPYRAFSSADVSEDQTVRFTAALCRLALDPSQLVDFLRPGAVIDLGDEVKIDEVLIFLNQQQEGRAQVMSSGENFLLKFLDDISLEDQQSTAASEKTYVLIALVDEIVPSTVLLSNTIYFPSRGKVSTRVSLLIGGEVVAKGELGKYDESTAVRILPRDEF